MVIRRAVLTIERLDKLLTNKEGNGRDLRFPSAIYRLSRKGVFPKSISIGLEVCAGWNPRSKLGLQNTKVQIKERWLRGGGLLSLLRLVGDLSTVGADQKLLELGKLRGPI